ncbi:alpha/beta hydrolase [Gordonia sp. TBRC 11910]|uniref:Alpha/beta hydrolase n=1 Tax=Gordonia asplenii TaxID=2725283 RepID=A0A848KWP6_9ACTN|nr:alpha/beta fold hydrolase [Gordonia asplenii]NMO03030.1 alpha/beta hydrolase [Gordonia asplenii]
MNRLTVTFNSYGTRCEAWFYPGPEDSRFDGPTGRPVVVMAHGFAGTKDSGLEPFALRLADAGFAVFAFDYRGFGASEGQVRQRISMADQADDYRAAIAAVGARPGIDRNRIVLWGLSQSGGHVLVVAAGRSDVCAVVSMVPMVSGIAAGRHNFATVGAKGMLRSTAVGLGSAMAAKVGARRRMLPVVGEPGENAALTAPGYLEAYESIAGPTWRNEVDAAVGLELGSFNADKHADDIDAPVLVQIADFDRAAPPYAASKTAFKARAQVRHYPCDHFDVFEGRGWFEPAVAHQLSFLTAQLSSVEAGADCNLSGEAR